MSRRALSKDDRRALIEAIDGMLDLMFVPIRKAVDDEIGSVEKQLGDLMTEQWDSSTKLAIGMASQAIENGGGDITEQEFKTLLQVLSDELGPGLQQKTPAEVTELVGAAYLLGKQGVTTEIGATMTLKLQDHEAMAILKKHHMFWIGNHYTDQIGEDIATVVRQVALDSGLGRKEVGRVLQQAMGAYFDKSDTYWRLLGAAAVHRARNLGGVSGLIDGGVKEYEILSVLDERTSDICRAMDGRVFTVGQAKFQRDAILAAESPEDAKDIAPWHSARTTPKGYEIRAHGSAHWTNIDTLTPEQMTTRGLALPPYHGFCRTTYIVTSFEDEWTDSPEPLPIAFNQAPEPDPGMAIPPESHLKYGKSAKGMGGAGEKHIYTDGSGKEFLFKPALSKNSGAEEAFRAYAQEFAADIQKIAIGADDFIPVKTMTLGNKTGTVQPIVADVTGDLGDYQNFVAAIPNKHLARMQQEHVVDWLISNHDSHGGQFITTKAGKLYAIDKEQAFRYFPDDKLEWDYHPNSQYGEKEPIYNTMMKAFIDGDIDLDLNHILPVIQRIEAIDDDDYKTMLRPYAEARFKNPAGITIKQKVDEFLTDATARKKSVRSDFESLYSRAMTKRMVTYGKRTGQPYKFQFADTMPAKDFLQAPLPVTSWSHADLQAMKNASVKELGKAAQIPYFQQMNKEELIECLVYPDKVPGISATVKERTRAKAALARAEGTKPKNTKPEPKRGTDPFEDLDALGAREFGYALQKDSVLVEGQHVNVRKVFNGTADEYQVSFKLLPDQLDALDAQLKAMGAKVNNSSPFEFRSGTYDNTGKFLDTGRDTVDVSGRHLTITTFDGTKIVFFNDRNKKAYRGRVIITVDGYDGKKGADKLTKALQEMKLEAIKNDPTPEDEKVLKLSRLIAQHRPWYTPRIQPGDRNVKHLSDFLRGEGIDPDQVDGWTKHEVWPGYFTYLDKQGADEMIKAGADHLFAGTKKVEGIMGILERGLMSTTERYRNGVIVNGASSSSDIESGGAESVFTRLVTKNAFGQEYSDSFSGGPFVAKINPRVLERTDWYAYQSDNYGNSEDYGDRKGRLDIVSRLNSHFSNDNEMMFRHGIGVDQIDEIRCQTEGKRDELLDALRQKGVKEINGKAIDKFVVHERKIRA